MWEGFVSDTVETTIPFTITSTNTHSADVFKSGDSFLFEGLKSGGISTQSRSKDLKEFIAKLPSIEETKYISESALWSPIATKYKTAYINIALRIYYQGTSDTLSSRNIAGRYPLGAWISEREILPCVYKYFWNQAKLITLSAVKLNYAAVLSKKSLRQTIRGFPLGLKLLTILAYPLGLIAVLKYPRNNVDQN